MEAREISVSQLLNGRLAAKQPDPDLAFAES